MHAYDRTSYAYGHLNVIAPMAPLDRQLVMPFIEWEWDNAKRGNCTDYGGNCTILNCECCSHYNAYITSWENWENYPLNYDIGKEVNCLRLVAGAVAKSIQHLRSITINRR